MSIAQVVLLIALPFAMVACAVQSKSAGEGGEYWVYLSGTPRSGGNSIHLYRFNAETGELSDRGAVSDVHDPNFLTVSRDNRFIYASTNTEDAQTHASKGFVTAFALDGTTGKVRSINSESSHGTRAVHVSLDPSGRTLLVANYQGLTVAALGVNEDGSLAPTAEAGVVSHTGSGPNPTRQQHPYLHSIYPDPSGKFAYACDLGTDKIRIYALDAAKHTLKHIKDVMTPPGSGPRHFAFAPDGKHAYLICEMGNLIIGYQFAAATGDLVEMQRISSLPPTITEHLDKQTGAEIQLHPNGKWLYASNRGPHSSITLFYVDGQEGTLRFVDDVPSGGQTPRYFAVDPTGQYVFAGNQGSDNVAVFRIDATSGRLIATGQVLAMPVPMCVAFVPVAAGHRVGLH